MRSGTVSLRRQAEVEGAQRAVFPNLKPTTRSISLRLPLRMLERIKAEANSRDVPYQSLIKIWLEEKLSARGPTAPPSRARRGRPWSRPA